MYKVDFPNESMDKESTYSAGDIGNAGSIPGSGRFPGGGHGNPLQYSCLENLMGERNLACCRAQGRKESDTTEVTEHEHV